MVPKCGNHHIPMYSDSQSNRGHWCGHSKHGEHNMAGNHGIQTVVPVQAHLRSSANIDNVIETLSGGYCHTVMVIHHIRAEITIGIPCIQIMHECPTCGYQNVDEVLECHIPDTKLEPMEKIWNEELICIASELCGPD